MADILTAEQRKVCMQAVRDRDTTPEMRVRRLAHSMGYRYALHAKIIFVHGCFWHKHKCRHGRISPVTNSDYWNGKRDKSKERDREHIKSLRKDGWEVLVIWECWTRDTDSLRGRLEAFL